MSVVWLTLASAASASGASPICQALCASTKLDKSDYRVQALVMLAPLNHPHIKQSKPIPDIAKLLILFLIDIHK